MMAGPTDHISRTERVRGGPSLRAAVAAGAVTCAVLVAIFAGRMLRLHVATGASAEQQASPTTSSRVDRGEILFQIHCAKCHGPEGHGDPEALAMQKPPPRDFARRPWRFEATLDSIRRITVEGIPGTAM